MEETREGFEIEGPVTSAEISNEEVIADLAKSQYMLRQMLAQAMEVIEQHQHRVAELEAELQKERDTSLSHKHIERELESLIGRGTIPLPKEIKDSGQPCSIEAKVVSRHVVQVDFNRVGRIDHVDFVITFVPRGNEYPDFHMGYEPVMKKSGLKKTAPKKPKSAPKAVAKPAAGSPIPSGEQKG